MSRDATALTRDVEPSAVCGVPLYAVDASSALPSGPDGPQGLINPVSIAGMILLA